MEQIELKLNEVLKRLDTLELNTKREIQALVQIQQCLVHERLGVAVPEAPKIDVPGKPAAPRAKKSNKIEITSYDDGRIKVVGNTYNHRDVIKTAGGNTRWDDENKAWSLDYSAKDTLVENLEAKGLVKGKDFTIDVKEPEVKTVTVVDDEDVDEEEEPMNISFRKRE